jgi:hypothetical protein
LFVCILAWSFFVPVFLYYCHVKDSDNYRDLRALLIVGSKSTAESERFQCIQKCVDYKQERQSEYAHLILISCGINLIAFLITYVALLDSKRFNSAVQQNEGRPQKL